MKHKLFFQINQAKPREFGQANGEKPFTITFSDYPTKEQLEQLTEYSLIRFDDGQGNTFRIFSEPLDDQEAEGLIILNQGISIENHVG